ncbi:hypothetical protein QQP08_002946 [Theobroma cacao]|nr:hypothetical protein QQP08_002946 [Theobroma cacao]
MESKKNQSATPESESTPRSISPCGGVKYDNAGLVATMRNSFSRFIHASMDEHMTCFVESLGQLLDNREFGSYTAYTNMLIFFPKSWA